MNRSIAIFLVLLSIILCNGCKNNNNPITPGSSPTWTQVNTGLTSTNVVALFNSGSNLYVGSDSGAFLSTNNGTNWKSISNGLPKGSIYCFARG